MFTPPRGAVLAQLAQMVDAGRLRLLVGQEFALVDAAQAAQELKALLEDNAPYQARVTFHIDGAANGWNAPATRPWFETALNDASLAHFQAPVGHIGQGGSIPLMAMLSRDSQLHR